MRTLRELSAGVRLSLPVQLGLLVAATGVVLDQATKELAVAWLETSEYVPWLGEHVGWQLVYNPGGAFGFSAPSWVFLIVTVLVVGIVARTLPATRSLLPATAYGLLLAGALGNLVDRALRPGDDELLGGHVVDFVAWGAWPRFNVADAAISVGFVLLVAALWHEERRGHGRRDGRHGDREPREGTHTAAPTSSEGEGSGEGTATAAAAEADGLPR